MVERFKYLFLFAALLLLFSCTKEKYYGLTSRDSNLVGFSVSNTVALSTKAVGEPEEIVEDLKNGNGMLLCTTIEDMPVDLRDTTIVTKGTPISNSTINNNNLGVLAYTYNELNAAESEKKLYSTPLPVSYDNVSAEWRPSPPLFWPRDNKYIQFYAYAPFGQATVSAADANNPVISYTTPSVVSDQNGLLVANPVQVWDNPKTETEEVVHLTFRHVLSGIRLRIDKDYEIQSVTLSGIYDTGNFDMTAGTWSDLGKVSPARTYSLSSPACTVDGDFNVMDQYFMLIPQTLPDGTTLTVRVGGEDFVVDMAGRELPQGKLTTFTFTYGLVLEVTNPTDMTYKGGTSTTATVKSYVKRAGGGFEPEEWKVEGYYTTQANAENKTNRRIITHSDIYISAFTPDNYNGGNTPTTVSITYPRVNFTAPSSSNRKNTNDLMNAALSAAPPKGSSTHYWNLANPADGGDAIVETANSYIVNAPGWYRIPLVAGNGVKNGVLNTVAYSETNYTDYKGNTFNSPYLHKSSASVGTPTKAFIIWEEQQDLIDTNGDHTDYVLPSAITTTGSGDNMVYWLNFHIASSNIKQGNAVVAVADENNVIMWSWLIWITTYLPANYGGTSDIDVYPQSGDGPSNGQGYYTMMPTALGWIENQTLYRPFPTRTVYARLEQVTSQGGLVRIMEIKSTGVDIPAHASGHCPFFQWGRKDAFQPNQESSNRSRTCYGTHVINNSSSITKNTSSQDVKFLIQNPWIWCSNSIVAIDTYHNWWFAGNTTTSWENKPVVKTIYDPCPAGYHVPEGGAFTGFTDNGGEYLSGSAHGGLKANSKRTSGDYNYSAISYAKGWCFYSHYVEEAGVNVNYDEWIFFPALGNLDDGGNYYAAADQGYCWTALPAPTTGSGSSIKYHAYYLGYNGSVVLPHRLDTYLRKAALAVRPVRDY